MMKDLKTAAGPFSMDKTFKETYQYRGSIHFVNERAAAMRNSR
jgi:hypothetical protein